MRVRFNEEALDQYHWWQRVDVKTSYRIDKLKSDIAKTPYSGIGHPKRLSGNLAGKWSRRIDKKNRLLYHQLDDDTIEITSCIGHYDDK